jgi:hypothetical protein
VTTWTTPNGEYRAQSVNLDPSVAEQHAQHLNGDRQCGKSEHEQQEATEDDERSEACPPYDASKRRGS